MKTIKEHLRTMFARARIENTLSQAAYEGRRAASGIQVGSPYLGAFEAAEKAGYGRNARAFEAFLAGYFEVVPYIFTDEDGVVVKIAPRSRQ